MSDNFGQDYWDSLFPVEKKKKYDPLDDVQDLKKLSINNPNLAEDTAKMSGFAPAYSGQPVNSWVPEDVARSFQEIVQTSENPSQTEARLNTAYYLSKTKSIPFQEAYSNMDEILQADYGKAMSPESGLEAVGNVFKAGVINRQIFKYATELQKKLIGGQYKTWDEVETDPYFAQILQLRGSMPPEDMIKRSAPVEFLKTAIQVIPSWGENLLKAGTSGMLATMATTLAMGASAGAVTGSVALPGIGTIAGAAGGALVAVVPTIATLAGAVFGATAGMINTQEAEGGAAFYDMMMFRDPVTGNRINPGVAAKLSLGYAGLSSMVELAQFDKFFEPINAAVSGRTRRVVQDAIKNSAKSVADASKRAGWMLRVMSTTAGKWVTEWGTSVAAEVAEEDIQQGLQIWAQESAKMMTKDLTGEEFTPATVQEIVKQIVDTTVSSAAGMGLLQAGPATISVWSTPPITQAEKTQEKPVAPEIPKQKEPQATVEKPIAFKTYDVSPGIAEIRGTTQSEGPKRMSTIRATIEIDDDNKIVKVSSLIPLKDARTTQEEAIRQSVELLKNVKTEFPGYSVSFNPTGATSKAAVEQIIAQTPGFFAIQESPKTPLESIPKAKSEESTATTPKTPAPASISRETSIPEVSVSQEISIEDKIDEIDSVATLQKAGAQRIESDLLNGGFKYTQDDAFPVNQIQFNPILPNFKEGANKNGVVKELQGEPEPLGMPSVVLFQANDGQTYIVTGRHRLDLWKRSNLPTIPAHIIKESDGYTIDDMAILDAEMNIRDNQGTEKDYARFFKRTGYSYERAKGRGLLRGTQAQVGFNIGSLAGDALQALYFSGEISGAKASAIASAAPHDPGLQAVGIKLAKDRSNTPEILENAIALFKNTLSGNKAMQNEMFDIGDDSALQDQLKIASAAMEIKKEIGNELTTLTYAAKLGKNDRSKFLEKYGYKLGNEKSLSSRLADVATMATKWEGTQWASDPELFRQAKVRAGLEENVVQPVEQAEVLFEPKTPYSERFPWIYKAEEVVNQKMQGQMPAHSILKMLQGAGVKADEMKWTGLDEFLAGNDKKTPQEVKEFIALNGLEIKEVRKQDSETKFSRYVLPGGESYRELLFTLPENRSSGITIEADSTTMEWIAYKDGVEIGRNKNRRALRENLSIDQGVGNDNNIYRSAHWQETNVLAHTRLDDRTTADGRRMLFIEEIQSDLHQEGRKNGYKSAKSLSQIQSKLKEKYGDDWQFKMSDTDMEEMKRAQENPEGVPLAPFSKTWHEFVFKTILREAVENGYDSIGWTTGEQQADRYDISKQANSIGYVKRGEESYRLVVLGKDDRVIYRNDSVSPAEMEDIVGKEMTKKIIDGTGRHENGYTYLEDLDLKVGGEGMKGFYDKILVDFANKYGKKWGAQVKEARIRTQDKYLGMDEFANDTIIHSLPITNAMRVAVPEGQYLFERSDEKYGVSDKVQYRKQVVKAREITQLMADNSDGFFNDEIKSFIMANNSAIVDALLNAKDENVSFISSAEKSIRATMTPAMDGSNNWDLNVYKDEGMVSSERFKSRTDAILSLYTETAPVMGGAASWKVGGAQEELFNLTPNQIGDLAQKEAEAEPLEYDEDYIKLVYGSQEAFDAANKQLGLFGSDEAGDLFAGNSDLPGPAGEETGKRSNDRRARPLVSPYLGKEGVAASPAFKENRKGQRRVDFVGRTISSAKDIAKLFQVYRNPQIETVHFIYTDDSGKILAHNAMSSGLPGRTIAAETRAGEAPLKYLLEDRMKRLGATKIHMLHNHPSGDSRPSGQDVDLTMRYINILGDKFGDHIVINHSKASVISKKTIGQAQGSIKRALLNIETNGSISYQGTGYEISFDKLKQISSTEDVARYMSGTLNEEVKNVIIITDYQHRVISFERINNPSPEVSYQKIKQAGGSRGFIVTSSNDFFIDSVEGHTSASRDGGKFFSVSDIVLMDGDNIDRHHVLYGTGKEHADYVSNKTIGKKTVGFVFESLAEDAAEYESYEEFKNDYLAEGEDESEVKKAWDDRQKNVSPEVADANFLAMIQDRERLRNFLEANGADLFDKGVPRKTMSIIDATSYRAATGGQIPETTLDRTLLMIGKDPGKWRKRYADLSGQETVETKGVEEDFDIESGGEDLTVLQARHQEAISNLPDTEGLKEVSAKIDEKVNRIRTDLEKKKRDLTEYESRFSYAEKRIVDMQRNLRELDKKIWVQRAAAKLGKGKQDVYDDMMTEKKELEAQITSRTRALSPEASLRNTAYIARQDAIKKTREELKAQLAVQKAKKAEHDIKIYYAKAISRPVPKGIDYKIGLQIKELQKTLDPAFRREGNEKQGTPLNQWSMDDLKALYEEVESLRDFGRAFYQNRVMELSQERSAIRKEMRDEAMKTGKERPIYIYGTEEQIKQARIDKNIFKSADISLTQIHRIARALDGGKEGVFYDKVVEQERDAFRAEKDNYDRRIEGFESKMRELGLNRDQMYHEKIKLGDQTISKWEGLALYIGSQNTRTEKAIVYGNMMSQDERDNLSDEEFYNKAMENRGLIKAAIGNLSPKEIALAEYLISDGEKEFKRIADATYEYENRIPEKEGVYYPHERKMRPGEEETIEEVIDQVMARSGKAIRNVGKQPTINRIDLADRHQSPINLDSYQVYRRGMERQEHYIAYARYISDMNSIWKNGNTAASFRETVRTYHGQGVLDYVDRWISESADPKAYTDFNKTVAGIDRLFKITRGPLGVAYLGCRVSRGVFQLITSPAPYLPYSGTFMIKRMVQDLNPAEFMKTLAFAKKSSAFIRHRVINPTDAYIKEYIDKSPSVARRKALEMSGAIMQWSDLWAVSTGWMSVYEKKAAELKTSGMTANEIHTLAVKEADKVTIETQPTYRHQDLSPAFKKESELERFLFQFQTPLNVIYNQLFKDVPNDWKSGHKGRALGIISGYLSVMGLMALITAPKDDDDDEDKKLKRFLSGVVTTPLEAIPFFGSIAAGAVESIITGDRFYRDDQIFPGVTKIFDGITRAATTDDDEARNAAFMKILEGSGMLAGVPTSAIKEYYRVIFEGDFGALAGKRK